MNKMNSKLAFALTMVLGGAVALPAAAELQVRDFDAFGPGSIIYDSASGLEWLKPELSGTRSYNDMSGADGSSEFAEGRPYAGFRYATLDEVKQLWINAGISANYFFYGLDSSGHNIGTYATNNSAAVNAARQLQEKIGYKLTQAYPPHVNANGWRTSAIAEATGGVGQPNLETCSVGTGFCGGSSQPMMRAHIGGVQADALKTYVGYHHWLVRAPQPKPKPQLRQAPELKPNLKLRTVPSRVKPIEMK